MKNIDSVSCGALLEHTEDVAIISLFATTTMRWYETSPKIWTTVHHATDNSGSLENEFNEYINNPSSDDQPANAVSSTATVSSIADDTAIDAVSSTSIA